MFPVFPSPHGLVKHGAKVTFNETLEEISKAMGMSRPKTDRLANPREPPYGLVLKREFSDTGEDVYLPDLLRSKRMEVQRAAKFVKERMLLGEDDDCDWLTQELAPFLFIGEIRIFCVGGKPIREVVTGKHPMDHPENPGELWNYEGNRSLKTISALQ